MIAGPLTGAMRLTHKVRVEGSGRPQSCPPPSGSAEERRPGAFPEPPISFEIVSDHAQTFTYCVIIVNPYERHFVSYMMLFAFLCF